LSFRAFVALEFGIFYLMSKTRDLLLAFLAGTAAGALAGVLFAPDKGKNTRAKLLSELENYKGRLRELLDELMNEFNSEEKESPLTPAKAEGEKIVNEAEEEAEKLLHDVEALIDQIRQRKG
jgi:gas vesicle protein